MIEGEFNARDRIVVVDEILIIGGTLLEGRQTHRFRAGDEGRCGVPRPWRSPRHQSQGHARGLISDGND